MRNRIFVSSRCPTADEWEALLSRDLPTNRIEEMEAHLDGCPFCVAHLEAVTPSLTDEVWKAGCEPVAPSPKWAERLSAWPEAAMPPAEAVGKHLPFERKGNYQSHGPIEFGGMGEVYKAWEIGLNRWVAIKIPSRARLSPGLIARFLKEAPRQAELENPNIVRVYARDEEDGVPFFSMELVKGETLSKAIRTQPFPPRRAAELLRQIASAIEYAHTAGVFHRDLKPANIMLTVEGVPKIVDFGLARTLDEPIAHASGRGAGTPEYMAPEQWEDEPEAEDEHRRTDVYGLGAVLYEMLTGRPPFLPEANRNEIRRKVRFDDPAPPRSINPSVPPDLEKICLRCLRKRPQARYATAQELSDALARFLGGYPIGECSSLTHARYFVGRHQRPILLVCAATLALATLFGLFASARWNHQREVALGKFDEGQDDLKHGLITDGINRMRAAIDLLPIGETLLRGYFSRNLKSLESSTCSEIDCQQFPDVIQTAAVSTDPAGRYVLVGDGAGRTILWDRAGKSTVVFPSRDGRQRISAVAINKSGTLCASGDVNGTVIVWDCAFARDYLDWQYQETCKLTCVCRGRRSVADKRLGRERSASPHVGYSARRRKGDTP